MLAFLDKIPYGTPRLRRLLFWALILFTVYVIIGFFILPPVVKSIIIEQATKGLNRETTLERVAFNPLTMRFELEGLRVAKREGEGALVSVGTLSAAPGIATLWKFAPVVSYLHLKDLTVDVTFFGGGKYSISDLIGSQRKPEDQAPEENETVFPFTLYGFEMTNATIIFDDRPHKKRHVISNLNLLVPFTSSFLDLRKEFTQPKFTAVVNGDPVELKGRTLPFDDTLRTEFELGAVDVDLHQYWNYLPVKSPLELVSGKFTSKISLLFERPDATRMRLFLGGGGSLTNLQLSAPVDGKVLSLDKIDFEMEKYSLGDNEMALKSIRLDKPYCKVIRRGDGDINWADYFPAEAAAPSADNATAQAGGEKEKDTSLRLDIRSLEVAGGSVDWQDLTVPGGFSHTVEAIAFKGSGLSTAKDVAGSFNLNLGKKGRITAGGKATLDPLGGSVSVKAEGFNLPDFRPYLAQAIPLRADSGVAGASAHLAFSQNDGVFNLAADNATLSLRDLALTKPDAKQPSIGLKALSVTGASFDLAAANVLVDRIELTGPSAELVREKSGDLDLAKLFAGESEPVQEEQAEAEEEAKQWTATVNTVRVTEGTATFRDRSLNNQARLGISGLQATLSNFTTRQNATMRYEVSTQWGGKGEISAEGDLGLDEFATSGKLRLKNVGLSPFDPYLGESTELLFASGAASADLAYEYSGTKIGKYTVTGGAGLRNVELKDDSGDGEFAGFDAFTVTGVRFENEPNRLAIQAIDLDGPRAAVDFDKTGRLNIRRALRIPEPPPVPEKDDTAAKAPAKPKPETEASKKEPQQPAQDEDKPFFESVKIAKMTMENGRVTYRDASVEPIYSMVLSDMTLGLVGVSQAPDARPKMEFNAKIGPTPMSVTGVLNPVITPMYSDLSVAVNGLEMVPLSPYTLKYMAYPVEKGRLYADVTFKTDDWKLDASNKFFIEQLVLGPKDKRPDAPNVPVKFGLALLQDGNGDMELNLPIQGRLDDPDFRIGGIVFKAIVSLFVKALASPFSLIGSIFGGGGENMDFVVFQPGRATLDQSGMQKLETVTKALEERQKLKLEVDGVVDPVADKAGLITAFFEAKLRQQKYESLPRKERRQTSADAMRIEPDEYEEFLYEAYADEPDPEGIKPTTLFVTDRQPVDVMEKFILDRIQVTQEDLYELARQRATAVKEFILSRDPNLAERVYLLDRQKDAKGKTGVPKHRADLGIK